MICRSGMWLTSRCGAGWTRVAFQMMVQDLGLLLRELGGRKALSTPVVIDSRILQSTPELGVRAFSDGAKQSK